MKIDSSQIQFPDELQSSQVGARKTTTTPSKAGATSTGVSSPTGEDTVRLSSTHGEVQTLNAQLRQAPEVRAAKVNDLQLQVRSGQYQPDSGKIADALIADQSKPAKA